VQRSGSRRRGNPQDAAIRAPHELLQWEPPPETIDAGNLARIVLVRNPEHLSGQERGLPNGCTFGCGRLFLHLRAIEPTSPSKAHVAVNCITFRAARLARLVL
jgi:hypothetical protein